MGAFHAFQIAQMVQIAQNIVAEITFKETLPIFFLRLLKSEDKEQCNDIWQILTIISESI